MALSGRDTRFRWNADMLAYELNPDKRWGITQTIKPPRATSKVAYHYDKHAAQQMRPSSMQSRKQRGTNTFTRACRNVAAWNNFVTSIMASYACSLIYREDPRGARHLRVLDVAGGKGGGMLKWHHNGCRMLGSYVLWDISLLSLEVARRRAERMRHLECGKCLSLACVDMSDTAHDASMLYAESKAPHVITTHFCINYMCNSRRQLNATIRNVSACASLGTLWLVTFLNGNVVCNKLFSPSNSNANTTNTHPPMATTTATTTDSHHTMEWHNSLVAIQARGASALRCSWSLAAPTFPTYAFSLRDAVDACDEHALFPDVLRALASSHGWKCVHWAPRAADLVPKIAHVCKNMRRPCLNPEEQEVADMYGAAIFQFAPPPRQHQAPNTAKMHISMASKKLHLFHHLPRPFSMQVDDEALFSVTASWQAQKQAKLLEHVLRRCYYHQTQFVVADVCACVGGNTCAFALSPFVERVHAIEHHDVRFQYLQHNAKVSKVHHKVTAHHGDCCMLLMELCTRKQERVDAVFVDPPWGGQGYKTRRRIDHLFLRRDVTLATFLRTKVPKNTLVAMIKVPINYGFRDVFVHELRHQWHVVADHDWATSTRTIVLVRNQSHQHAHARAHTQAT